MKKRLISLILAAVLLLGMAPGALAAITPGKPKYGSASGYGTNFTLTGNLANDVIAVAKAQKNKGMKELGYSSAWCDAFVVDCARIANVPTSVIPNTRGCKALYDAIIKAGGVKVTSPQAGDVVIYYCSTCKNYPHIGFYAGNKYVCEGNVGGSAVYSDRSYWAYVDGSGHTSKNVIQMLYVRPNYTGATVHTLNFNANGGSGSMASVKALNNTGFSLPKNTFTRANYQFAGWTAKRSDGKWHCVGQGWKTEAEIAAGGYTKTVYKDQVAGTFNTSWTTGTSGAISVTFYAQWEAVTIPVYLHENYSGKNYFLLSNFPGYINASTYNTRDASVYDVSYDEGRGNGYGAMKIVGTTAGSSGKDLLWRTITMGNNSDNGYVGDNKPMTLSFWAKSSVAGAKFYVRWGYQTPDKFKSVTLTTDWAYYTIRMDKTPDCGTDMHPYFDKAGTFWISELQVEDGTSATAFASEGATTKFKYYYPGEYYTNLPVPEHPNRTFEGWYTAARGGERVDESTPVADAALCLYAHWSSHVHDYTSTVTTVPGQAPGVRTYTCTLCGDSYTEIIPPVVDICIGLRCPSENFTDVASNDWFHPYVDYVVEEGLMKGTSTTRFEPDSPMTRAMLVTVLWRLAGSPIEGANVFYDVPVGEWYTQSVAWAAENGVVNGIGGGYFDPNGSITREQMASILFRYCGKLGLDTSGRASLAGFPDNGTASDWAVESLQWAVNEGLLAGSDGKLLPGGNATRAQVATILARFIEYVLD